MQSVAQRHLIEGTENQVADAEDRRRPGLRTDLCAVCEPGQVLLAMRCS